MILHVLSEDYPGRKKCRVTLTWNGDRNKNSNYFLGVVEVSKAGVDVAAKTEGGRGEEL